MEDGAHEVVTRAGQDMLGSVFEGGAVDVLGKLPEGGGRKEGRRRRRKG